MKELWQFVGILVCIISGTTISLSIVQIVICCWKHLMGEKIGKELKDWSFWGDYLVGIGIFLAIGILGSVVIYFYTS